MPSPLENLSGPGNPLRKEPPDAKEFAGLKQSALRRFADAEKPTNSLESRFDLVYNAAHALCLAALRHAGYRPTNRYLVFQVLPHTLGLAEIARIAFVTVCKLKVQIVDQTKVAKDLQHERKRRNGKQSRGL